jgi:hypothetical protein
MQLKDRSGIYSTSNVFKDLIANSAWASASNLVSGRNQTAAAGTQTASILFGGKEGPPPNAESGVTQEYNGSGWSNGGSMSASRYELGGAGTQTAGLAFGGIDGGSNTTATEEYGGTSWTSGGALTQATYEQAGAGTQTAALAFGGQRQPEIMENNTQKYDGSSWTNTGSLNEARRFAYWIWNSNSCSSGWWFLTPYSKYYKLQKNLMVQVGQQ